MGKDDDINESFLLTWLVISICAKRSDRSTSAVYGESI
ncbi:hypothetical protein FOPG_13625 [Fusarium oxysporum f. sp. conglutinans race 2 54008]|uniref:Uncharacterized protein n=2 Tax=Fusarium oxysporum TaxID=5507 RepID=X0H3N7_FUSOX|nr:hypothetical protein FOVG_08289 [Fusarium oxysporum f. sp. pisi HDV247]EXL70563.1 hypothetical protein FOPG_13625 [Fusarium oxysporum f. sp. conglutinans race 2 54008]